MATGNVLATVPITQWLDEETGKRAFTRADGLMTFPPGADKGYVARVKLGDLLGVGGGLTVDFGFASDRPAGGNARFAATVKKLASGTDTLGMGTGAGTEIAATPAAPTAEAQFRAATIALTSAEADAPAAGDYIEIRLRRTGTHDADTHADGRLAIVTPVTIKQT